MNWLRERDRQPEIMDQPGLAEAEHQQALNGLRRANALSGTIGSIWKPISVLARQSQDRPLRILDVASGGGDLVIGLSKKAALAGLNVRVEGCDISQTALSYASQKADACHADVSFFYADAINDGLPEGYDVICSSLFFHHLDEMDVIQLMKTMRTQARQMVIISDLLRTRLGYALCWLGIRLITRSKVCHVDGPLSVQGAFTMAELADLAEAADMETMKFQRLWPERCLMTWKRP